MIMYDDIRNMDASEWYCFNDTRVEIATPMEVEKSFGGMQGGWTNSNTNAYMLMYRQVGNTFSCERRICQKWD